MTTKAKIYGFAESITPPLLFRLFRHSFLYRLVVSGLKKTERARSLPLVQPHTGPLAGRSLRLDPDGAWQTEMINNTYDHELFSYLTKIVPESPVIYDIGAHVGYHTLMFAALAPSSTVYSFEPNTGNFARVQEHLTLNADLAKRITVYNLALSDKPGQSVLLSSDDIDGGTSSGGFIDAAAPIWSRQEYIEKTGYTERAVTLESIDSLVSQGKVKPPTVIKIDVEGAEHLVLEGARKTLEKYHPHIIVEFHSIPATYTSMNIIEQFGYRTTLLKQESDGRVLIAATHN